MAKIEVKCFALNDFGQGVFKIGKNIGYASNLLPKEVGLVENFKDKYYVSSFLKTSNIRVTPNCSVYNKCGGCHLLHMNYDAQIQFKVDYVTNAFSENKLNTKIDEIIKADKKEGYRNKMQVSFQYKDNKIVYGFYEEESHRIIPMSSCLVQTSKQNEIAKYCASIMQEMHIAPYNEDKRTGVIRFIMIREGFVSNEILVTIVTNSEVFPGRNDFIKRLRFKCPYITSIVQNINSRKTSIILGDDERVLFGPGYINDTLCGISFKISSKTFYQINHDQTEKLYQKVIEYANLSKEDVVLDAYCGVGTIGMVLANKCKKVIGVENNKQSVLNARQNAYENKIKNINFVCDDATVFLESESKVNSSYDIIVMDPPRNGSTPAFINAVCKIKPQKIVYVSCEAKTMSRDIALFSGYKLVKKCIVDMFVGTYHVETIVLMERK